MSSARPPETASALAAGGRWLTRLPGRLFPPSCALCGSCVRPGRSPVCRGCWSRLPRAAPPRCARCGAPGPRFADDVAACGECLDWPSGLTRVRAPFLMRDGAAEMVRALKYRGWTALAGRMGAAMAAAARRVAVDAPDDRSEAADGPDRGTPVLVPVPLSPARRRQRGFNQASLLARSLARAAGWEVEPALRRVARGRRQARLGRASRRENAPGLFRARAPSSGTGSPSSGAAGAAAAGARAVVVDDVVTTGSTAAACTRALRSSGWRPAGAVAFARAVSDPPPPAGPDGGEADPSRP